MPRPSGLRGVAHVLDSWREARRELEVGKTVVLKDLAALFRKGEEQIFRTHGTIINKPWAPLAESTARSRARLARRFGLAIGPRAPRLVLFGDMKDALTKEGGPHHVAIEGSTVRVLVDQGAINKHNRSTGEAVGFTKKGKPKKVRGKGGRYPDNIIELHEQGSANRPPRKVLGIPPGVQRSMDARVQSWFDKVIRKAGGD